MASVMDVGHTNTVQCIATGNDMAASGDEDSVLSVWSPDGSVIYSGKVCDDNVMSLCFAKKKPWIFVACGSKIFHYDTRTFKEPLNTFTANTEEINQLVLNEKEEYLAACDDDGLIRVYNLQDKKVYKTLRKHDNICTCLAFRPNRPWELITGGTDCLIKRWDFSRGKCLRTINQNDFNDDISNATFLVNPPFVHSLSLHPDGRTLAAGVGNCCVNIFDVSQKGIFYVKSLRGHTLSVSQVHFPFFMQNVLFSGGNDGRIFMWDSNQKAEKNGTSDSSALPPSGGHLHCFDHGDKINWLTSWDRNGGEMFIADQTNKISKYSVPK